MLIVTTSSKTKQKFDFNKSEIYSREKDRTIKGYKGQHEKEDREKNEHRTPRNKEDIRRVMTKDNNKKR